jgi:hypothetical protein
MPVFYSCVGSECNPTYGVLTCRDESECAAADEMSHFLTVKDAEKTLSSLLNRLPRTVYRQLQYRSVLYICLFLIFASFSSL